MFKNLQDKVKNLWIALGEAGLVGILKALVSIARVAVDVLTDLANNSVAKFIMQTLLAVGATKALISALNLLKGSAVVSGVMSLTTAIATFSLTSTAAAGSAGVLARAVTLLQTAMAGNVMTAAIASVGYLIYKYATYTQTLKDTAVELGVVKEGIQGNIAGLASAEKVLTSTTATQEQQNTVLDQLITAYPLFAIALKNAAGNGAELSAVLKEIKEKEDKLLDSKVAESMENTQAAITNLSRRMLFYNNGLKRVIQTKEAEAAEWEKFNTEAAKYTEDYIRDAKLRGMSDDETLASYTSFINSMANTQLLFGNVMGEAQTSVAIERMRASLEAAQAPAKEAGNKIGTSILDGITEELSPEELEKAVKEMIKDATADLEYSNKVTEAGLTQGLLALSVAEAKGVVTHEAAEMAKLNATIEAYDKMVQSAVAYQAKVAAMDGVTPEQQEEAQGKVTAAIEKAQAVRLQKLEAYATKRQAIEDKIAAQEDKSVEEQTKNNAKLLAAKEKRMTDTEAAEAASATKIKEITSSAITKRIAQEEAFEAKKKELVAARVEIERSAAADIQSINDTLADKILNIRMKGLTDEQKQGVLASAANSRLEEGKKALAQASKQNDTEAIARAKELISSAGGYYEQLADSGAAINGLKKVAAATIDARKAQEKAALADNTAKMEAEVKANANKLSQIDRDEATALTKAKARLAEKLVAINNVYTKAIAAENARHTNEMANIAKEVAALKQKADAVSAQQDAVIASMGMESPTSDIAKVTDPSSPDFDWSQYEKDVGIAVANGIRSGTDSGVSSVGDSIQSAVAGSVADGTKQGIFDGVEVEGLPLEEWKTQGKKQGDIMAEAMAEAVAEKLAEPDFDIWEDIDGKPITVSINPATESEIEPLIDSIKEMLDKYPGEPTLDFTAAEALIKAFVIKAQKKYKIEIPVTSSSTQAKAAGGQVYAMASGGKIPGTKSPKDKVNVLSRPGEWYINDEQASSWNKSVGSWFMNAVHKPMSQAGQYLKDSVLKGPSSRAVPVPVPTESSSASSTDVLSSLQSFGTLNINIGGATATVLASTATAASLAVMFKKIEDASSS
jgi:hypothetical protein